jgi:hypothetical protein
VLVDLAGLALGIRDPAAVPGFSTSMSRAHLARDGLERRPMLTTDARQRAGIYRVDHDEESIACVSRLCGLASVAKRQTAPINPANLDAALEKDPKHHDGFDHSSA